MKVYIMLGLMLVSMMMSAQASTIILRDGRTITGYIIRQDNSKVVIKDGDNILTYYNDEIVSMDGKVLSLEDGDASPDPEKEKLVDQLMGLMPTKEFVSDWAKIRFPTEKQHAVLAFLDKDQSISTINELRKRGFLKYFSADDLKNMIDFYASPEGRKCWEDYREFNTYVMPETVVLLEREADKIKKNAPDRQP